MGENNNLYNNIQVVADAVGIYGRDFVLTAQTSECKLIIELSRTALVYYYNIIIVRQRGSFRLA